MFEEEGRMAIHSFIQPHEYTLRRAIKAWFMRLIRKEDLFKISFYTDELGRGEAVRFIGELVKDLGGPTQQSGRLILVRVVNSWADIGEDKRPGEGPRSRTIIEVQGKSEFVEKIAVKLKEEKKRRHQPGKRRRGLISLRKGMWGR